MTACGRAGTNADYAREHRRGRLARFLVLRRGLALPRVAPHLAGIWQTSVVTYVTLTND